MTEGTPEEGPTYTWVATWGDQLKVGDLMRVAKLGGPVRVQQLRRFSEPQVVPAGVVNTEERWYYGVIVVDRQDQQFHLFIKPYEACFVALEVPTTMGPAEGTAPEGSIG